MGRFLFFLLHSSGSGGSTAKCPLRGKVTQIHIVSLKSNQYEWLITREQCKLKINFKKTESAHVYFHRVSLSSVPAYCLH